MSTEPELRQALCEIGRRLYAKNLVSATDGNISVRLGADRYLCTRSGVSKGDMTPDDILVADGRGQRLNGEGKVTSEFFTHLAAYEERDDIGAVVHAHPPKTIGLMLAGVSLEDCPLPEVVYVLGGIPTADYATPATKEGAGVLRPWIGRCDAVLLDRHGAITVGKDVFDAFHRMEKVEHAAEAVMVAHFLGRVRPLSSEEKDKLYRVRESYGVTGRLYRP